jgi:hypothetical protein
MEINPQTLEAARKRLEDILNSEISATEEVRRKDVVHNLFKHDIDWEQRYDWKTRDLSAEDFEKNKELMKSYGELVYVRTTEPYLVAIGTHQVVLNVGSGLVAKSRIYVPGSTSEDAWEFAESKTGIDRGRIISSPYRNEYLEKCTCFALGNPNSPWRKFQFFPETIGILKQEGFDIPPIELYRYFWSGNKIVVSPDITITSWKDFHHNRSKYDSSKFPNVCITPDLREQGRYQVVDYDEATAKNLVNGNGLAEQFKAGFDKLIGFRESYRKKGLNEFRGKTTGPYLINDGHSINDPETAIRRMFLLQVPNDKTKPGKLVIGDLDHVNIFR